MPIFDFSASCAPITVTPSKTTFALKRACRLKHQLAGLGRVADWRVSREAPLNDSLVAEPTSSIAFDQGSEGIGSAKRIMPAEVCRRPKLKPRNFTA